MMMMMMMMMVMMTMMMTQLFFAFGIFEKMSGSHVWAYEHGHLGDTPNGHLSLFRSDTKNAKTLKTEQSDGPKTYPKPTQNLPNT